MPLPLCFLLTRKLEFGRRKLDGMTGLLPTGWQSLPLCGLFLPSCKSCSSRQKMLLRSAIFMPRGAPPCGVWKSVQNSPSLFPLRVLCVLLFKPPFWLRPSGRAESSREPKLSHPRRTLTLMLLHGGPPGRIYSRSFPAGVHFSGEKSPVIPPGIGYGRLVLPR
jgi:hypothetical protein